MLFFEQIKTLTRPPLRALFSTRLPRIGADNPVSSVEERPVTIRGDLFIPRALQ